MSRLILIVAFVLACFPIRAGATPPRVATVADEPIAFTKSHIFLLRMVDDNIGQHGANLVHRFLVKQNLKTGLVEAQWPVRHVLWQSYWVDTTRPTQFEEPPTDRWRPAQKLKLINPWDILRRERALPLSPFANNNAHNSEMSWAITPEFGLLKSLRDEDGPPMRKPEPGELLPIYSVQKIHSAERLRTRIKSSLMPTMTLLSDLTAPTEVLTDPMSWSEESLPLALDECIIRNHISLAVPGNPELISVDCAADNEVARFRIWVGV